MDEPAAQKLIDALSSGANPFTGELLDDDHLCQHPDIIRALCLAARALEERRQRTHRQRHLPGNVGKPWRSEETGKLVDAFQSGKSLDDIARDLQRTPIGIQVRLERLGLLPSTTHRWPTPASTQTPAVAAGRSV